jgi:alanyl-tRNA synthetase
MVQNILNIGEREDRILNIVKAKFGLKNKSEAVALLVANYEENFLELELRPEYIEKLQKIEKEGYGETFSSVEQLRKKIEKR